MGQPQQRTVYAPVVTIDGQQWAVCPIGGHRCFRVPYVEREWADDAVTVHVRVTHLHRWR